jgi:DNA end-binding protein Ku
MVKNGFMPRALWKGAISFGLVTIPVDVHSAVNDVRPHFRMLHKKDLSPVRFQRVCIKEDEPLQWDDLVKGYEYQKGKYAVLTDEDFERAALEKSKTVDILNFVKADDIDDRYYETPYYLTPGKGGDRAYALLREALRDSGRVGIAKIILREVQHLAALAAVDDALVLTMMRFADELRPIADYEPKKTSVRSQELSMAKTLIKSLEADWKPDVYEDEYRANLMKVIRAKIKGKEPKLRAEERPHDGDVVDLMERLRTSLESGRKAAHGHTGRKSRSRAKRVA